MTLSVIVTLVDGGDTLARCLDALGRQHDPPALDVIVPWDDSVPGMPELTVRFPAVRFLPMGPVRTARAAASAAGQHELFDRRRSAGLAVAGGSIIAILEDRGAPRPGWAKTMMTLHAALPHAAIGGAIENGRDVLLNWAVYFCDFGRYQLPFAAGPRPYVSDVNIGYKRRAIEATAALWRDRYHETTVHWALQRAGETLYLSPDLIVDQFRDGLRWTALVRERFAWGRLFAYTRAREIAVARRLGLAVLSPLLPVLLFLRHARKQLGGPARGRFIAASPLVLILLAAWSLGEAIGYITGAP